MRYVRSIHDNLHVDCYTLSDVQVKQGIITIWSHTPAVYICNNNNKLNKITKYLLLLSHSHSHYFTFHNRESKMPLSKRRRRTRTRQTDRQTETQTQTDRQRKRHTQRHRQRHRQTDRQTERTRTRTRKLYFTRIVVQVQSKTCLTTSPC